MEAKYNPLEIFFRWINAGLILVLAIELIYFLLPSLQLAGEAELPAGAAVDTLQISHLSTLDTYQEAIDRSLFSWNRKPVSAARNEGGSGELPEKWQLSGLVKTKISTYAIFGEINGDRQLRLERGMLLEKWTIDSVTTEEVILVNGDEQEVFRLDKPDTIDSAEKEPSE